MSKDEDKADGDFLLFLCGLLIILLFVAGMLGSLVLSEQSEEKAPIEQQHKKRKVR